MKLEATTPVGKLKAIFVKALSAKLTLDKMPIPREIDNAANNIPNNI
jgi:hypothetical protein